MRDWEFVVSSVETTRCVRRPPAPFTTAELLGAASDRLGFDSDKCMTLAQALFEKGAVTYIRTDSTELSQEAVREIRQYLGSMHPELLGAEEKAKSKGD